MKIAIKGHRSRGKEVIQILKSLGGKNTHELCGNGEGSVHYYNIDSCGIIRLSPKDNLCNYKFYTLEEFEKEFPFKIGDKVIYSHTPNLIGTVVDIKFDNIIPYQINIKGATCTCGTNMLKPYKEMKEERNITLTLDKAKEWYKKGGELKEIALQAFTEKELNPLPRSWEEFCNQGNPIVSWKYRIPIKYEALFKLEQLRDCWRGDWKPEWNNCEKYVIKWDRNDLIVFTARHIRAFLVFPTREMAYEFLKCFRNLIEQAGDLI